MTATGPLLVEADAVYGIWAVHQTVMTGRGGVRVLMGDVYATTHVPSGISVLWDVTFAQASLMAQRLNTDCPSVTLTDLITKGSAARDAAKLAKAYALSAVQDGAA